MWIKYMQPTMMQLDSIKLEGSKTKTSHNNKIWTHNNPYLILLLSQNQHPL